MTTQELGMALAKMGVSAAEAAEAFKPFVAELQKLPYIETRWHYLRRQWRWVRPYNGTVSEWGTRDDLAQQFFSNR